MDLLASLFVKLVIFTIGILFLVIIIGRLSGPSFIRLLGRIEQMSENKLFRRIFWITGILLFVLISVFLLPSEPFIAVACGLIGGLIYLFMIFSIIRLLHNYMNEDE